MEMAKAGERQNNLHTFAHEFALKITDVGGCRRVRDVMVISAVRSVWLVRH